MRPLRKRAQPRRRSSEWTRRVPGALTSPSKPNKPNKRSSELLAVNGRQ
jgi:hypothetical protein